MTPARRILFQAGVLVAGGAALLAFSAARLADSRGAAERAELRARECAVLAVRIGTARDAGEPTTRPADASSPRGDVGDAVRAALAAAAVPESSFVGSSPDGAGAAVRVALADVSLRQAIGFLYQLDAGDGDARVIGSRFSRGTAGRWSLELTIARGRSPAGAAADVVRAGWPAGRGD